MFYFTVTNSHFVMICCICNKQLDYNVTYFSPHKKWL